MCGGAYGGGTGGECTMAACVALRPPICTEGAELFAIWDWRPATRLNADGASTSRPPPELLLLPSCGAGSRIATLTMRLPIRTLSTMMRQGEMPRKRANASTKPVSHARRSVLPTAPTVDSSPANVSSIWVDLITGGVWGGGGEGGGVEGGG